MFTEETMGWHDVSRAVYKALVDHSEPVFSAELLAEPGVKTTSNTFVELDYEKCVEYRKRLPNRRMDKAFAKDYERMTKCIPWRAFGWPGHYKFVTLPKVLDAYGKRPGAGIVLPIRRLVVELPAFSSPFPPAPASDRGHGREPDRGGSAHAPAQQGYAGRRDPQLRLRQ